ncbi:family 16 glycosylhydrolase [Pontiellaceae bacterium B12227]|nr:family 16 glycosylhydrolase [Pontiellaceae bacterium B12227]
MQNTTRHMLYVLAGLYAFQGLEPQAAQANQPYPRTDPSNVGNWILLENMSDEFTNGLDHAKWQVCGKDDVFWADTFNGRTYNTNHTDGVPGGWQYSPDNIQVTNGLLKITTKYEPDYDWYEPGTDTWTHTTAGMWSKGTFSYGYMEIRCKLADEKQTGAFWTTGNGAELDVFEAIGKHAVRTNWMWSSIHDWQLGTHPNNSWTDTHKNLPFSFSDGFHTYAAEWNTNSISFYADGQLIHHVTKDWIENTPTNSTKQSTRWPLDVSQHVWADSEIFEWWGVPDTNNPASDFEVDYIRIWQKGPPQWQSYASRYGISGVKTDHSDTDGLNDWHEYIFGGDPTNSEVVGISSQFDSVSGDFTFHVRNDASLSAHILTKTNLTMAGWNTNSTINIQTNTGDMGTFVAGLETAEPALFWMITVSETNAPVPPPPTPVYQLIIGGSTGNGDFEANSPSGAVPYDQTPNWYNASGSESTVDAIDDSQMNGSSQYASHGGLPSKNRVQINNTGYTVLAAGEVFSLSYDFGAGGSPAEWTDSHVEMMRTFLFTLNNETDWAHKTASDITELGGDNYIIARSTDGQWTTRTITTFYTTSASDVGKTVYFGMEFNDEDTSPTLSPRIDVIELEVNVPETPE